MPLVELLLTAAAFAVRLDAFVEFGDLGGMPCRQRLGRGVDQTEQVVESIFSQTLPLKRIDFLIDNAGFELVKFLIYPLGQAVAASPVFFFIILAFLFRWFLRLIKNPMNLLKSASPVANAAKYQAGFHPSITAFLQK
jgi:hypothetical protein